MAPGAATPYPLVLAPVLLEKVWGGRALERLGKALPAGKNIGESWELADLGRTSASGAGGGEVRSRIQAGPLEGRTVHDAVRAWGGALLGDLAASSDGGGFPLLVKFLDARENLSVQVHPSAAYAAAHADAHVKTECWVVVAAEPGALIYKGLRPGVRREAFVAALRGAGGGPGGAAPAPRIADLLLAVPAVAGECHSLPSGVVHALGAGVLVAEVQTPSDTTFRVFDWGRQGRELHVEQALACIDFENPAAPPATRLAPGELCGRLATTDRFTVDQARPQEGDDLTIGYACRRKSGGAFEAPFVLVALAGSGTLLHAEEGFEPVPLARGDTVLVPAAVARRTVLRAGSGLDVLRVGFLPPPDR